MWKQQQPHRPSQSFPEIANNEYCWHPWIGLSNLIGKLDERKVRISSTKSSSTLFSCSLHAMYNRLHCAQNNHLMLKSFIPAINKSNFPKKHYENNFSENLSMDYMPGLKIAFI